MFREIWPNSSFGESDEDPEGEFMCFYEIFRMDVPSMLIFMIVVIISFLGYTNGILRSWVRIRFMIKVRIRLRFRLIQTLFLNLILILITALQ